MTGSDPVTYAILLVVLVGILGALLALLFANINRLRKEKASESPEDSKDKGYKRDGPTSGTAADDPAVLRKPAALRDDLKIEGSDVVPPKPPSRVVVPKKASKDGGKVASKSKSPVEAEIRRLIVYRPSGGEQHTCDFCGAEKAAGLAQCPVCGD